MAGTAGMFAAELLLLLYDHEMIFAVNFKVW